MRRSTVTIAIISLLICTLVGAAPTPASAQTPLAETFQDTIYGGLIGGCVGGAVLVFQDHPQDHLIYIAYGAAIGVIAGAIYGVVTTTRAFAEVERGEIRFAVPMVIPALAPRDEGGVALAASAELFRARF